MITSGSDFVMFLGMGLGRATTSCILTLRKRWYSNILFSKANLLIIKHESY